MGTSSETEEVKQIYGDMFKKYIVELGQVINQSNSVLINSISEKKDDMEKCFMGVLDQQNKLIRDQILLQQEQNRKMLEAIQQNVKDLAQNQNIYMEDVGREVQKAAQCVKELPEKNEQMIKDLLAEVSRLLNDNFQKVTHINQEEIESRTKELGDSLVAKLHTQNEEVYKALKDMIDRIVEKNAESIGNVQADNKIDIKKLQESIQRLSLMQEKEIERQEDYAEEINGQYEKLIQYQRKQSEIVGELQQNKIENMTTALHLVAGDLKEEMEELFKDGVKGFSESMDDYRDEFLKANAEAIANVQKDNIDIIKEIKEVSNASSTSIGKIVDSLEEWDDITNDFLDDVKKVCEKPIEAIASLETVGENLVRQSRNMGHVVDEQNSQMSDMLLLIEKLESNIEKNSQDCKNAIELLKGIQTKKEALTEKDIKLMEELMKKV